MGRARLAADPAPPRAVSATNLPHAFERFNTIQVITLVDFALRLQYVLSFSPCRMGHDELEHLVAVEAEVKPKRLLRTRWPWC